MGIGDWVLGTEERIKKKKVKYKLMKEKEKEKDKIEEEIITDKKTGKKIKKRKIKNENGDIEDVDEIIESDMESLYTS